MPKVALVARVVDKDSRRCWFTGKSSYLHKSLVALLLLAVTTIPGTIVRSSSVAVASDVKHKIHAENKEGDK